MQGNEALLAIDPAHSQPADDLRDPGNHSDCRHDVGQVGLPAGAVEPNDSKRPVAIDHQTGQPIACAVDDPPGVGVGRQQPFATSGREWNASAEELADRLGVTGEHPDRDISFVGQTKCDRSPLGVAELHRCARWWTGLSEAVCVDPWMSARDGADGVGRDPKAMHGDPGGCRPEVFGRNPS